MAVVARGGFVGSGEPNHLSALLAFVLFVALVAYLVRRPPRDRDAERDARRVEDEVLDEFSPLR